MHTGTRWLIACSGLLLAGCQPFVTGFVPEESGFEGAVTVVFEGAQGLYGTVTVEVPYLDIAGQPAHGFAELLIYYEAFLSDSLLPVFCHAYYPMDSDLAMARAAEGWIVVSPYYTDEAPRPLSAGDGINLSRAIVQWVRRLPFIDPARLHLDGLGQGGYAALALSADLFPIASATADHPIVNWAYTLNYIEMNRTPANYPGEGINESPLPQLYVHAGLAEEFFSVFPADLSDEAYYLMSPVAWAGKITHPVLVTAATGDLLSPMEQMTADVPELDAGDYPEGYTRDFETLTLNEDARILFEDCLPEEDVYIAWESFPEGGFSDPDFSSPLDRPWSASHRWSFCYLDEGAVSPFAGHTSEEWYTAPDSFLARTLEDGVQPESLTAEKLEHLLRRYTDSLPNSLQDAAGQPILRANYAYPEQWDVLAGLADYARLGSDYETRLSTLYASAGLQPFGSELTLAVLESLIEDLAAE